MYVHIYPHNSVSSRHNNKQLTILVHSFSMMLLRQLQQPVILKILGDNPHRLLDRRLLAMDMDLRILGCFIRRTNAGELLNLSRLGLLVQALGITLLRLLHRHVDEDLDKGQRRAVVFHVGVQVACDLAVGFVGRDEGCEGYGGGVGEKFGDLLTCQVRVHFMPMLCRIACLGA